MGSRCPTCSHGTSGCVLTAEQWRAVYDAVANCRANLQSRERSGLDQWERELLALLEAALEAMPTEIDDE